MAHLLDPPPRLAQPLFAIGLLASLSPVAGCGGGDDGPPKAAVPPAAVRDFTGLVDGNCWRYRYARSGSTLFTNVSISGPNEMVIAGAKVYLRQTVNDGGGFPDVEYLDTEHDGEVRLLRLDTTGSNGMRLSKRYETPPVPTIVRFLRTADGTVVLPAGSRIELESTPVDGQLERHAWRVSTEPEMVQLPDGPAEAIRLEYRYTEGANTWTAFYSLVPGKGFAKIVDFQGTTYQVCAQRVCDSGGNCTGAPDCNLSCPL